VKGISTLTRAMFLGWRRDRAALFFTLLFPLIFLLIFGSLFKSGNAPKAKVLLVGPVPMVEQAPADVRARLNDVLKITRVDDLAGALAKVKNGDDAAAIEQHGNQLVVHFSQADATASGAAFAAINSLVEGANLAATGQPARFQVDAQQVEDRSLKPIQYITPGILGYAIALGATFGASATLVTWRQKKILRRLTLSPVKVQTVITARVAVAMVIALIQMAIFLAVALLPYFGLKLSQYWWMAVPLILAATLAFLSIGLLAGAKAKSMEAASAIANLITIPMAFLSGSFFPIENTPGWIQALAKVFPLRHLNVGMLDVMVRGKGPLSVLPQIGILLGFAVVLSAIAARLFRWDDV
jgi:ABC-2 type transport system permease protein